MVKYNSCFCKCFSLNLFLILTIFEQEIECGNTEPSYRSQGGDWGGICATGKKQSPINVVRNETIKTKFTPFSFTNYEQEISLKISNTKRSLKFSAPDDYLPIYVQGGGLQGTYQFLQGHMHWSPEDNSGSEHTIDGKAYPMELHLVHYNTKYGKTASEAIASNEYNALAVLSIMFDVKEREDNKELQPLFDSISKITKSGETTKTEKIKPSALILDDRYFFRYNGSLTTPGCNEIVVWTLFKVPLMISQKQFDEVLKTTNSKMEKNSDNYRSVQNLNGRTVLDSSSTRIPNTNILALIFSLLCIKTVY